MKCLLALGCGCVALLTLAGTIRAASFTWNGSQSSDWMNPANWTPSTGVPISATDTATVAVAFGTADIGTNTIALARLVFVDGTIQGAAEGRLTILDSLVWTGGWLKANVTLTAGAVSRFEGGADKRFTEARAFVNAGTIAWSGGTLSIGASATFSNLTGAVFDLQADVSLAHYGGASGVFWNDGTFRKTGGAGVSSFRYRFVNADGDVRVQSGALQFEFGGASARPLQVAPGCALTFWDGYTWDLGDGANLWGGGTITVAYATVNSTGAVAGVAVSNDTALTLSNDGRLGGTGDWTINGPMRWNGGWIQGSGLFRIGGTVTVASSQTKYLQGRRCENAGTVLWQGGDLWIGAGAVVSNLSGATFDWQSSANIIPYNLPAGLFWNNGTFRLSGSSTLWFACAFTHAGDAFQVQSGALTFALDGSLSSPVQVMPGATLTFANGGTWNLADSVTFSGGGTCLVESATLVSSGLLSGVTVATGTTFVLGGGTLSGAGPWTVNGAMSWLGGNINDAGLFQINGPLLLAQGAKYTHSRILRTAGVTIWTGGDLYVVNGGLLENLAGGEFNIQTDATLYGYGTPNSSIINRGTWRKSAGSGTFQMHSGLFTNAGTFQVSSGTVQMVIGFPNSGMVRLDGGILDCDAGYTQSGGATLLNGGVLDCGTPLQIAGGRLGGNGTVQGSVVLGDATLAPGLSPGALTVVGNLTLSNGSTTRLEVGGYAPGAGHDRLTLQAGGILTLAGQLDLTLANGFEWVASGGSNFTMAATSGTTIQGAYANAASGATLETADGQGRFQVHYGIANPAGWDQLTLAAFALSSNARAPLAIRARRPDAELAWPAAASNLVVYASTNLLFTQAWTRVTNQVIVTDGSNTVLVPGDVSQRYFRLQK